MFQARIFVGPWSPEQVRTIQGAPGSVDIVILRTFNRQDIESFFYFVFDGGKHPAVYSSIEEMEADSYSQPSDDTEEIKKSVWENLSNGLHGQYTELLDMEPNEVVADLKDYASDMEDLDEGLILPHVISWQEEQAIAKAERGD